MKNEYIFIDDRQFLDEFKEQWQSLGVWGCFRNGPGAAGGRRFILLDTRSQFPVYVFQQILPCAVQGMDRDHSLSDLFCLRVPLPF